MSTNRENISLSRDKEYLSPRHDHLANNHNIVRKQESSIKAQNTDDAKSPKANSRSAPVNANGARCPAKKDAFTSMGMSMVRGPITRMPCEPGTGVSLEGIVWQETDGGNLCFLICNQIILIRCILDVTFRRTRSKRHVARKEFRGHPS